MTSAKFNAPRLMGNCENCYYATDRAMRHTWVESGFFYDCHRFPQTIEKERGGYCGEFAWNSDASLLKEWSE